MNKSELIRELTELDSNGKDIPVRILADGKEYEIDGVDATPSGPDGFATVMFVTGHVQFNPHNMCICPTCGGTGQMDVSCGNQSGKDTCSSCKGSGSLSCDDPIVVANPPIKKK